MGNFMIPTCCMCGVCANKWHDPEWEDSGGLQDFCPGCANAIRRVYGEFQEYIVPHLEKQAKKQTI